MAQDTKQVFTGIDVVSIKRVKKSARQTRFCKSIFTEAELSYCMRKRVPSKHLAGRFAAKEACIKALSFAPDAVFGWRDMEVVNDERGCPSMRLHSGAAQALGKRKIFVSIAYSRENALAFVAVE